MHEELDEQQIYCPYCGERISVLIDPSEGSAEYIEDCSVCCRPIVFQTEWAADGHPQLRVSREDD